MIKQEKEGLAWLEFELFKEEKALQHGVFLRQGGQSQEPFSSLNTNLWVGDSPHHVEQNIKKIMHTLHLPHVSWIKALHGNRVEEAKKESYHLCDGLMTEERGCALLITHADCQAAIFYDPIHHKVANVHAGWRGQVANIYRETVFSMQSKWQTKAEDLLVAISPSLGPENAEFIHYQTELPTHFWPFQIKPHYFDLWKIARFQLEELGILPHHIQIAEMDTYVYEEDLFSYRRAKKRGLKTGCNATIASLV